MMKPTLIVGASLLIAGILIADQNDDYSNGVVPQRLSFWPESLKEYQELPESRSPDGKYGFIYPKRTVVEEMDGAKLYLGQLKPFATLGVLPIKYANLCGNTGSSYFVKWAPDSSGAIFYAGGKKGPFNIFVVSVQDGRIRSTVDLETPIRKLVQTSYDLSHGPRFNDYFDFIFTDGDDFVGSNGKEEDIESSWSWKNNGQVLVQCVCTNDPKRISRPLWEVVFTGTWDVASESFVEHRMRQIDQRQLPPF